MQTTKEQFRDLQDEYFDHLDSQGIEYLNYDQADQGHIFTSIKQEYQLSAEAMSAELGYDSLDQYLLQRHFDLQANTTKISVEQTFGRFIVTYDGKDISVNDAQDSQSVVFSSDLAQDDVELLCTGLIETMKKYNAVKGGV